MMRPLVLALMLSATLCSCGEIYEDITVHDNGQITIRKEFRCSEKMLALTRLMGAIKDSTRFQTEFNNRSETSDTAFKYFYFRKDLVESLPGFVSCANRDTTIDSLRYVWSEVTVTDTASLAMLHQMLWRSGDSILRVTSQYSHLRFLPDSMGRFSPTLKIVHRDGALQIHLQLPNMLPDSIKRKFSAEPDRRQMTMGLLSGLSMNIRVFSDRLALPQGFSPLIPCPGGQMWRLKFDALMGVDAYALREATFVIRDK